jgi:hypothetical protein
MRVRVQNAPKRRSCLVCGIPLGLIRKLKKSYFCTDAHEEQYLAELSEIAIERLRIGRQRLDGTLIRRVSA